MRRGPGAGSGGPRRWRRVLAVLAIGLAVAACTPPGLPPPIAPSGESASGVSPVEPGTITVGIEGTSGSVTGFNPYEVADYSLAARTVASLVLPSVFVTGSDGVPRPDPDLVDAVVVTSQDPFTVTYTLDRRAAWTDGTPVTAEDFSYLRDQLLVQPATVDPAGYGLITAIRSRDAGKTVVVEFAAPFPDWRTLFSPLLPSHLMKDFPGGWGAALNADIPLAANQYRMRSYDPVTGQIRLARNDKYWGDPPGPAAVVLRLGDPRDLVAGFARGDLQAVWLGPDVDTVASLEQVAPPERRTTVPEPVSTQLIMNVGAGPTSSQNVRKAIAAALDPPAVADALAAGWTDGARRITSQVRLPAQVPATDGAGPNGGAPIITNDPQVARGQLAAAGYRTDGLYATRAGQVLRLTLGYPTGDPRTAAAARTVQRQLGEAGIEIDLLADNAPSLLETQTAAGALDLSLVELPRGRSDAVATASAFSCAATAAGPPGQAGDSPPAATPTAQTTPAPDPTAVPLRTGNLSGYCAPSVDDLLTASLTRTGGAELDAADPELWTALPVFPIVESSTLFAVSPELQSVLDGPRPGWLWTGPLQGLPDWPVP